MKKKSKSKNFKNKVFENEVEKSLKTSLPISDEGTKAKPYKRVLAINLPSDLQTIDAVTGMKTKSFFKC